MFCDSYFYFDSDFCFCFWQIGNTGKDQIGIILKVLSIARLELSLTGTLCWPGLKPVLKPTAKLRQENVVVEMRK